MKALHSSVTFPSSKLFSFVFKCSSQKDYVILATRTPPREEQNESPKDSKAKLDNLDEEWATEHAHQVIMFVSYLVKFVFPNKVKILYSQVTRLGFQSTHS